MKNRMRHKSEFEHRAHTHNKILHMHFTIKRIDVIPKETRNLTRNVPHISDEHWKTNCVEKPQIHTRFCMYTLENCFQNVDILFDSIVCNGTLKWISAARQAISIELQHERTHAPPNEKSKRADCFGMLNESDRDPFGGVIVLSSSQPSSSQSLGARSTYICSQCHGYLHPSIVLTIRFFYVCCRLFFLFGSVSLSSIWLFCHDNLCVMSESGFIDSCM